MEDDQTDPEMVLLVLMERAFKGPTHEGVRILDWAPQLKRVLKCVRENDPMTMELRGEIERLRAELAECRRDAERYRRLCSLVAWGELGVCRGHNDTDEFADDGDMLDAWLDSPEMIAEAQGIDAALAALEGGE